MTRFYAALGALVCASSLYASFTYAQQTASPVEIFSQSRRAGVPSQPLVALTVTQALPVEELPQSCPNGQLALAINGRTFLDPIGKGRGVVVRCQEGKWMSLADAKPVQS